jgi:hypothetical protein
MLSSSRRLDQNSSSDVNFQGPCALKDQSYRIYPKELGALEFREQHKVSFTGTDTDQLCCHGGKDDMEICYLLSNLDVATGENVPECCTYFTDGRCTTPVLGNFGHLYHGLYC